MVHSRLSILSLLCLFHTALLLPLDIFIGPPKYSKVSLKDAGLQETLAFAMSKYNQKRTDTANYFKMEKVMPLSKKYKGREYHIKANFLKTECKKTTGKTMTYVEIQRCKQLPGKPQKESCDLKVLRGPMGNDKNLITIRCS